MLNSNAQGAYEPAAQRAREAWCASLNNDLDRGQELLLRTRTELKRLSGDLPILGQYESEESGRNASFVTRSYAEAEAWGWLEMASGLYQMLKDRPGAGLMHFKRAWRIWRPWSMQAVDDAQRQTAARERIRAALWLSTAWSRLMSERAMHAAEAVRRAALSEIARLDAADLLEETTRQQARISFKPGAAFPEQR